MLCESVQHVCPYSFARLEATIYGRVQGVYFRETTRDRARHLKLTGWVKNNPDGSVSVVAEGAHAALEELLRFLHQGPPAARVETVRAAWGTPSGDFREFTTRW